MTYIKENSSKEVSKRESDNRKLAYIMASEGIVLLENDGTLPLKVQEVALFGPGAKKTIKGGTGSGEVNERHSVSIYEGLINAGFQVSTEGWLNEYDTCYKNAHDEWLARLKKKVPQALFGNLNALMVNFVFPAGREIREDDVKNTSKVAIYVISRQSGEGADRRIDLFENDLTDAEIKNIKFVASHYEKTILVINSGCSLNLKPLDDIKGINAIVFFAQQGEEGGNAFASVLTGAVNPSGKLSQTWAKDYSDIPFSNEFSYNNGDTLHEYYKEGIFVGYRYFDSFNIAPRYYFGFGLSYTSFDIQPGEMAVNGSLIKVQTQVKNTGSVQGKEVVQVYVSSPKGDVVKEYQSLAGFAKTKLLAPGEIDVVNPIFDLKDMSYYDEKISSFVLDKGDYLVRVGNSSSNTKVVMVLTLNEDIIVSQNKKILSPKQKISCLVPKEMNKEEDLSLAKRFNILKRDITTVIYSYEAPKIYSDKEVDKIINTLSNDELIEIVVGDGFLGTGAFNVPGTVGRTTSKLIDKGLENVNLSDGPAGIRISMISGIDHKGNAKSATPMFGFMEALPKFVQKFMMSDLSKDRPHYQFATAFPIGMSIAQTWNADLEEEFGKAISTEMSEFGITYWLAPGMNIMRNPLCGRNFEYYSEDPVLSGLTAKNVVLGVQSVPGNYATVKHFCANNMEDNRFFADSIMDERVLREIYLRNFMYPVRDGNALSVMTSYNKINGTYTSNCYDTVTNVLRCEWGFKGVVMTDWLSTKKGCSNNVNAIKIGNDLIMPGGKYFKKEIKKGLVKGELSLDDLKKAAANVIHSILSSHLHKDILSKLQEKK